MQTSCIIKHTDSGNEDFQQLVALLDEELRIRDGENFQYYADLNKTAYLRYAIVMYENEIPVGCGSVRPYEEGVMEIKRMYVVPAKREQGIASAILLRLEEWAKELGAAACILETGKNQPEAIAMYKKSGYQSIPPYGKYTGSSNSVCFKKQLTS